MKLWRLLPAVEARLRAVGYNLTSFDWSDHNHFEPMEREENDGSRRQRSQDAASTGKVDGIVNVTERMFGCDIYWGRDVDAVSNSKKVPTGHKNVGVSFGGSSTGAEVEVGAGVGAVTTGGGDILQTAVVAEGEEDGEVPHFVGLMGEDDNGTWVSSQNVDGLDILIKDDLKLWPHQLWVNDRGFDRAGNFVYGNQRGVPYKMHRVVVADGGSSDVGPLEWTLGEGKRTKELYAAKMAAIGVMPGQRLSRPPAPRPTTQNNPNAGEGGK